MFGDRKCFYLTINAGKVLVDLSELKKTQSSLCNLTLNTGSSTVGKGKHKRKNYSLSLRL